MASGETRGEIEDTVESERVDNRGKEMRRRRESSRPEGNVVLSTVAPFLPFVKADTFFLIQLDTTITSPTNTALIPHHKSVPAEFEDDESIGGEGKKFRARRATDRS